MQNKFYQNIVSIYGNEGRNWFEALPHIVKKISDFYHLFDLTSVDNLSFNYVMSGYQRNIPIILKLGLNIEEISREAYFLKECNCAPDVIEHNKGMIIMQRAVPGTTLKDLYRKDEEMAAEIFCDLAKKISSMSIPSNHNFKNIEILLDRLDQRIDIPSEIIVQAKYLRDKLLSSSDNKVVLHGDLHHENILKHQDEWVVIDPKGYLGDPAFEVAAYLSNPVPDLLKNKNFELILLKRISLCAKYLNIEEKRIFAWLYVKAILCWAWCLEDNISPKYWSELIAKIEPLLSFYKIATLKKNNSLPY